jgi:hypothetical protein
LVNARKESDWDEDHMAHRRAEPLAHNRWFAVSANGGCITGPDMHNLIERSSALVPMIRRACSRDLLRREAPQATVRQTLGLPSFDVIVTANSAAGDDLG